MRKDFVTVLLPLGEILRCKALMRYNQGIIGILKANACTRYNFNTIMLFTALDLRPLALYALSTFVGKDYHKRIHSIPKTGYRINMYMIGSIARIYFRATIQGCISFVYHKHHSPKNIKVDRIAPTVVAFHITHCSLRIIRSCLWTPIV